MDFLEINHKLKEIFPDIDPVLLEKQVISLLDIGEDLLKGHKKVIHPVSQEYVDKYRIGQYYKASPRQKNRRIDKYAKSTTAKGRPKFVYIPIYLNFILVKFMDLTGKRPTMGTKDEALSPFEKFATLMLEGHPIKDKRQHVRKFLSARKKLTK